MKCAVCGVSRDAFADEAAWFAHVAIHPRAVSDDPWQQARVVPATSRQGKRLQREREQLAREQAEWRERQRYARKRNRQRAASRRYYYGHQEKENARSRTWYWADPDHARQLNRETARRWRLRHPDWLLAQAVWRRDNPDKVQATIQRRLDKQRGNPEYNEKQRLDYIKDRARFGLEYLPQEERSVRARQFEQTVANLRAQGMTWTQIGMTTGTTAGTCQSTYFYVRKRDTPDVHEQKKAERVRRQRERDAEILALREQGHSWSAMARILGYANWQSGRRAYMVALDRATRPEQQQEDAS